MSERITDTELVKLRNHGPTLLELARRHVKEGKLKRRGDEYDACCPFHDEKHPSFSVNVKTGVFNCLKCNTKGDTIAFAMKTEGLNFVKACELVAQTAGIPLEKDKKSTNGKGKGTNGAGHTKTDDWTPLKPTRDTPRPIVAELRHYQFGEPTDVYEYVGRDGYPLYYVRRFDRVGQKKEIRPLSYGVFKGKKGWHEKAYPTPRPLFRLDAVAQAGEQTIVLVEGEKAVKAAEYLYPNYVITTWSGGAMAVAHSDFTPLGDGANVILWPDADDAGRVAMMEIAALLPRARWLDVSGMSEGFDAADLEEDDPQAWFDARIQELPELPPKPVPEGDPYDAHELPEVQWIDHRLSDWNENELPERLWIVPGWIPREQVTGLYGPPGTNKTDFLIQLMMATSLGLPFMGLQLERMPTFGLFCEDTEVEIARRGARIARHYGMWLSDFPDFHYASLVGYSDLEFVTFERNSMFESRALKRFDMTIDSVSAKFACLDTAPHFFGGSEIDRRQVSRFLRRLDAISITRGCGIVISAHPSARGAKVGGRMESGSTGWEGGVRARIALTKPDEEKNDNDDRPPPETNARRLTLWKSNYAPPGKTIDLVWNNGVFTTAALDPERAKTRGPQRNNACDDWFKDLITRIEKEGRYVTDSRSANDRYAPRVFAQHPEGKEFSQPEYHRAMQRLLARGTIKLVPVSSKPSDQRRKLVIHDSNETTTSDS